MKICIIAEGSYPFIVGGVSSWVQMVIKNMPEHEFSIFAIGAEEKLKDNFSYKIPDNVYEIKQVFMDNYLNRPGKFGKNYKIGTRSKESFTNLITGDPFDWNAIFQILREGKIDNVSDFFMSKDFFNIIKDAYLKKYNLLPFNEFFWMVRSLLLPIAYIIIEDLPEADIYHSVSTGYAGVIASLAKWKYNKPFLLSEHGIYSREREEEIIRSNWLKGYFKDIWIKFFYNLSRCSYEKSDLVTSLYTKNKNIQIELGCSEETIRIIPNGIDIEGFSSLEHISNGKNIVIGSVLRVVPIKDIKTMLKGFSVVKEKIPNAKFLIMGPIDEDIEYYQECLNFSKELGLTNLTFTGKINVKEYLPKIDILVLSSISEAQPLILLEAMASRIPFVSTDVGCCREIAFGNNDDLGQAGIIVPVMNYQAFGDAIIKLCNSTTLRKAFGEVGFKRTSKFYTRQKLIDDLKELYFELKDGDLYGRNRL